MKGPVQTRKQTMFNGGVLQLLERFIFQWLMEYFNQEEQLHGLSSYLLHFCERSFTVVTCKSNLGLVGRTLTQYITLTTLDYWQHLANHKHVELIASANSQKHILKSIIAILPTIGQYSFRSSCPDKCSCYFCTKLYSRWSFWWDYVTNNLWWQHVIKESENDCHMMKAFVYQCD